MTDLLTKTGVRQAIDGVNVGSGFYEALDGRVEELVQQAVQRARDNNRATVKARDV